MTLLLGRSLIAPADRRRLAQWSDLFVEHQILVNDVRLAFVECKDPNYTLERWMTDTSLRQFGLELVPDGFVLYAVANRIFAAFLEVDRGTEALRRWREKTAGYLDLAFSGRFQSLFGRRFFRVLVLAPSSRRLDHLREEIWKQTPEIFWLTTTPEFMAQGPFSQIWRRVADSKLHSLTEG